MSRAHPLRPSDLSLLAPAEIDARDRDAAFRAAKRHSRRVRTLRWVLPSAALGGLALIALIVWLDPLRFYRDLPIEFGRISITDNKLTIEAPKLTGFTQDQRPYSVTAETAAQDLGKSNIIELTGIHGQVDLAHRGEAELHAKNGVYDTKAGNLNLSGGIEIMATGGYRIWLTDASVEIRKGRILTEKPIKAVFPDGSLDAQRLEILDHGDRVRFDGGVVVTLRLPPPDEDQTADVSR